MTIAEFWQEFLNSKNLDPATVYSDCFYFELNEKAANQLLQLVLQGKKRATSSSLFAYEAEKCALPQVGDYSIVTDWDGTATCVIQTTGVQVLAFKDMTFELCKREGEDENLASWQQNHRRFFSIEGTQLGYEFSEEMMLVFEDFQVVYSKQ